jgi:lysophospholipase L1-like esterase
MKRFLKNNICLFTVVFCSLALEGYGLALTAQGYAPQEGVGGRIALAALSLREGIFPWNMETENEMMVMAEAEPDPLPETAWEDKSDVFAEAEAILAKEELTEASETAAEDAVAETAAENAEQAGTELAETPVEVTDPRFQTVTDDYFSDAVFIGDSRIVGVCEYAGMKNATFYAKTSMTIYKMLESRVETTRDVRTVQEGLKKNHFRKVYLMVGLNELGVGNTEYFINAYRNVVQEIQRMQPDALIYIQGIMHVSGRLDRKKDSVFNNEAINRKNEALAALAEEMGAVYLDVNEAYDDENGDLPASYTADDVHLKANHYDLWHEYYLTHAVEVPETTGESGE